MHLSTRDCGLSKNGEILSTIGRELKENPPAILERTRRKFGLKRARQQKTAILLSKARQAGAKIPSTVK